MDEPKKYIVTPKEIEEVFNIWEEEAAEYPENFDKPEDTRPYGEACRTYFIEKLNQIKNKK